MDDQSSKPLIFISHKHCDRKIAEVLRGFIRDYSGGHIDVCQSSSPFTDAPKPGSILNKELIERLWRASVFLLLYTDADKDWGYCMWEAGVATKPDSPDTNIIVLQCGGTRPQVFQDRVSVNTRKLDEVQRFVNEFLTSAEFVPRLDKPVTGFVSNSEDIARIAADFFQKLTAVLPPEQEVMEEWPACPFLQLSMDLTECDADRIRGLSEEERALYIQEKCLIVDADIYCAHLFGYPKFLRQKYLKDLVKDWEDKHHDAAWARTLSSQIADAAMWQFPKVAWEHLQGNDNYLYAPVLTRVRRLPNKGCMEFDIYFDKFERSMQDALRSGVGKQQGSQVLNIRH